MNSMAGALKGMGVLANSGAIVFGRSNVERFLKPGSKLLSCDLPVSKLAETKRLDEWAGNYNLQKAASPCIIYVPDLSQSRYCISPQGHVTYPGINGEGSFPQIVKSGSSSCPSNNLNYSSPAEQKKSSDPDPNPDKPSLEQLQIVYNTLQQSLEKLFTHPMNYRIYNPEIVFIDNIRNLRTQGLAKYIQQVALLKTVGHIKFAYVRFEILNMSMSHEEGRITVRWRIKGLSGLRVMLKFWKYKLWKWQEIKNNQETWYDGISYFDVGGDGKVFQHIADKVMEDKHRELDDKRGGNVPLAAKLAALATIFPTPSLSFGSLTSGSTITGSIETT